VNVAAVIFNWSCLAVVTVVLVASLTVARRTRWGRPGSRWILAGCVAGEGAELFNLYTRADFGAYVFWLVGPFLIMAVVAGARSSHGAPSGSE
jgi:hypothetical protein